MTDRTPPRPAGGYSHALGDGEELNPRRAPAPRARAPLAAPQRAPAPAAPVVRPTPASGTEIPSLVVPPPWVPPREVRAIEEAAESAGTRVQPPPPAVAPAEPPPVYPPPRLRPPPWWEREDGVAKVLGAVGVLVSAVLGAFVTYRATAPAPPPPADIECPAFADEGAPRGKLCTKLQQLEGALGRLQAERDAIKAREARARKMLGEEPPTVEDLPK